MKDEWKCLRQEHMSEPGDSDVEVPYAIHEPRHEISNNVVCATSKSSDQPAHTRRLIRAVASCLNIL